MATTHDAARHDAGHEPAKAKAPAFPKTLVRVRKDGAGWTVDERIVADASEESAATKEGFHLPDPVAEPEPIPYPAWRYHTGGQGAKIVNSEKEDKALGAGWHDTPTPTPEQVKAAKDAEAKAAKDKE